MTNVNNDRNEFQEVDYTLDYTDALPGIVMESFEGELIIATGKGALSILELQGSSGKRLKIRDFLRGNNIPAGIVFK